MLAAGRRCGVDGQGEPEMGANRQRLRGAERRRAGEGPMEGVDSG